MLGHKTPSHPDRVCARVRQRAFNPGIVDVTALKLLGIGIEDLSGTKTHCLVRLTHKHAMAIRLGEERDRAQRCAVLLIEIAGGMDEAHGGFAAIYDDHALKFEFHSFRSTAEDRVMRFIWRPLPVKSELAMPSTTRHPRRREPLPCGIRQAAGNGFRSCPQPL